MHSRILQSRPHLIPALIAAIMLVAALADWPYGYYQLLRFVTCGVAAYIAYLAYQRQKMWAAWLFGLIAVLFNPLIPVHLNREAWAIIDCTCAMVFVSSALFPRRTQQHTGKLEMTISQAEEIIDLISAVLQSESTQPYRPVSLLRVRHSSNCAALKLRLANQFLIPIGNPDFENKFGGLCRHMQASHFI